MTQKDESSDLDTTNSAPRDNAEQPDDENWSGDDEHEKHLRWLAEATAGQRLPELPQYYLDE